jgi:hypothetical protein
MDALPSDVLMATSVSAQTLRLAASMIDEFAGGRNCGNLAWLKDPDEFPLHRLHQGAGVAKRLGGRNGAGLHVITRCALPTGKIGTLCLPSPPPADI